MHQALAPFARRARSQSSRTLQILLCCSFLAAFGPLSGAGQKAPNVLLISVDTLRADALAAYGGPSPTPHIDELAAGGAVFEDTLTTIGKTGPSFASLFSSLYPPTHGARRNGVAMRPDVPVLAEKLKEAGYQTAAFISNWTLRTRLAAVHRGFDHYDEEFNKKRYVLRPPERDAETLQAALFDWLPERSDDSPLFLWVHFSEPHTPYKSHQGFEPPQPAPAERTAGWQKRWRYASEVMYTDHQIGLLLERLGKVVDLDDSLVVFVADHGESLGEHDYWGHGKNALWPNLRIPLIIKGPGVPAGVRTSVPASIVDITPTLLELLQLPTEPTFQGRSLVGALSDQGAAADGSDPSALRARYALGDRHTALTNEKRENFDDPLQIALELDQTKTVFDFQKRETIYFDLSTDPNELRPLREPPIELEPPLRRRLANWYRQLPKYEASSGELSEEDRRALESLGYVGAP